MLGTLCIRYELNLVGALENGAGVAVLGHSITSINDHIYWVSQLFKAHVFSNSGQWGKGKAGGVHI
ncbi:hypothetical protein D3C80_1904490 [compost metagenome]